MTHEDAFIRAITEGPEDDTHRLVYADWLEENGQPERARFIRLQCEAAAMPWDHPRRSALYEEIGRLLRRHGQGWLGPLPRGAHLDHFDRGMPVAKVQATARNLFAKAEGWFGQAPVSVSFRLDLRSVGSSWPAFLALPWLGRIWGLRVVGDQVGDDEVAALAACPSLDRLASLDLSNNPLTDAAARAVAASAHLHRLADLSLSSTRVGPAGVEAIVGSPGLARLAMLDLQDTPVGDDGVAALAASPRAARLTWLNLAGCSVSDRGAAALASSPHLSGVNELRLWSNDLGDRARQALRSRFGSRAQLGPER